MGLIPIKQSKTENYLQQLKDGKMMIDLINHHLGMNSRAWQSLGPVININ
jgi:hypothetical protein